MPLIAPWIRSPGFILAASVIAILMAVAAWLHFHDQHVITQHEAGIATQVAAATQAANDLANTNDTRRQVENAKAAVLTEEALRHAAEDHPAEVRAPAGPAVNAVAEQLRARQTAARAPAGR